MAKQREKDPAKRAYAEALRRIEEAGCTRATRLDLSDLGLRSLPPDIGALTRVQMLVLHHNQLSSLPPEIGALTALQELNLFSNQLSSLPPEIGALTALQTLILHSNQLSSLPPEIGALTALQTLSLYNNQLSSLPPEIGTLTALQTLRLSDNRLSSLPPEIGALSALQRLDLQRNQLSFLPPEIGALTALQGLSLSNNRLSSLPSEIGALTALQRLWLYNNQFSFLPPEIRRLTRLEKLFLHDNPALNLPPEVLGPTVQDVEGEKKATPARPADILDYYFRTRDKATTRPLNEVKVILVGQGAVGKTSLVKRIVYGTFNPQENKTDGIYINKEWNVGGKGGAKVQVNFWDFGGQEIMHATHQFFLTKRTVYVLVLDARKGENESNIHYWLKIIRSYGGDSPVLVVTNKCETHYLDLNETRLKKDYPNIRGFFRTSCDKGLGIDALKDAIRDQIHAMPHVFDPLPLEYFEVKRKLEGLAEHYIDIRKYHAMCHDQKIAERERQDQLLRFLHDLGSMLSFNDPDSPYALREMSVLKPEWVTEGVYKVLNDERVPKNRGELSGQDLARILDPKTHPRQCHPYITEMMGKFELAFAIRPGEQWLVAELLPKNEPEVEEEFEDALRFQYHYEVLPAGIICRFIVRRYRNLTSPPVYWRSGVVLEFDGCRALVRSDTDKGRMHIAVAGAANGRRSVLAVIRDEFAQIHGTLPHLKPEHFVPLPDHPAVVVPYEHLLTLERQEVAEFVPQGADRRYAVSELLAGIEAPWGEDGPYLYPPFFGVVPQTSFADAWEVFCCEALNRHEKTTEIRRRHAPEGGVDLLWREKAIAYQCKSVESGRTGDFDVGKAIESVKAAIARQAETGWKRYVICTNVELTGPQEKKLREAYPDVGLLTPSFWIPRCHEQWRHVEGRFRFRGGRTADGH